MLKRVMITTAAAALLAGTAIAQSPAPPPATSAMPAAKAQVVGQQTADQLLASKFRGTDVIGADNQKIGDVNDILFDKDAKIVAYVVGVGGFLGIGSKDVALTPASFQIQPANDRENMKLKLSMTKDELKNATDFKPYKEPTRTSSGGDQGSPTTGMARDRAPATPPAQR